MSLPLSLPSPLLPRVWCVVVIVCVFVVCWLPFHVARTLFCLSLNSSVQVYFLSQYLNLVSFVLFYCSAAINPLLYNIMSSRYRDNVRALLRPRTRPLPAPSPSSTHFWPLSMYVCVCVWCHLNGFWEESGAYQEPNPPEYTTVCMCVCSVPSVRLCPKC